MDEELPRIVARHKHGEMEVLPVLVSPTRPTDLLALNFLQIVPGKPTALCASFDRGATAFAKARNEILDAIEDVIQRAKARQACQAQPEAGGAPSRDASVAGGKASSPGSPTGAAATTRSAGNAAPPVAEKPAVEVAARGESVPAPAKPPGVPAPRSPATAKATPAGAAPSAGPVRPGPLPRMEFVEIPAGEFIMGSDKIDPAEKPAHRVRITRPFEMQTTPVTQAQWEEVMGTNPSRFKEGSNRADRPVENVSWFDAQELLTKLSARRDGYLYRLPTEAEWEYACRAGGAEPDVSPNLDEEAWHLGNSGFETHPVAEKKRNARGLYDMRGNVFEWVADWMGPYDFNLDADSGEVKIDPQGPEAGGSRVLRGGSWRYDNTDSFRCASRDYDEPGLRCGFIGFRCARTQ